MATAFDPGRAKTAGGEVSSGMDVCGCDCKNPAYSSPLSQLDGSRVRAGRTSNGGTALAATVSRPRLRLDRCDQRSGPHDVDDAGKIVGEHVQRHFRGDAWQRLHQEMGCSPPRLDCPERMLDCLTPLAHFFRVLVEPALHGFENMLMLPARDPSFLAGGAAVFDGAARAGIGPIAAQDQPVFFVGVAVGETFTCRTDVEILTGQVAEVLLAEAPNGFGVRSHRLWQSDRNAGFLARQDLGAVEVASIRDDRPGNEPVHLLVDSTGLKLCGPGEWLVEKHAAKVRRSWRKLHIGVDADTGEIIAAELTSKDVDDGSQVGPLLEQIARPVASFTGDGAYDREDVYHEVCQRHPDAAVIVPPRSSAVPSATAKTAPTKRDRHLQLIAERGRMGWQRASGYNWRALVEADIGRYKRVIGDALRSRTEGRQTTEVAIAVASLNRMLELGRPEYVRLP